MGGAESARKIRTLAAIINETRKQEDEITKKEPTLSGGCSSNQIRPAELVEGGGEQEKEKEKEKETGGNTSGDGETDEEHEDFMKKLSYGEKEAWEIHKKQTKLSSEESQSRLHELTDEAHRKLHENNSRRIGRKAPEPKGGHKKRLSKML